MVEAAVLAVLVASAETAVTAAMAAAAAPVAAVVLSTSVPADRYPRLGGALSPMVEVEALAAAVVMDTGKVGTTEVVAAQAVTAATVELLYLVQAAR